MKQQQQMKIQRPALGRTLRGLVLGAGLALSAAGAANAQFQVASPIAREPFQIKAGVFVPTSALVRRFGHNELFALEGSYRIQSQPESRSATFVNGGVIVGSSNYSMVPVTLSQLWYNTADFSEVHVNYFYGIGAGIYVTKLKSDITDGDYRGLFGGFLTAGVTGLGPLFAEVKYHWVSRYTHQNVGGWQATVGIRL